MGLFRTFDLFNLAIVASGVWLGVWPRKEEWEDIGFLLIVMGILIFSVQKF